ncbi:MAG: hypothetical protein QOE70_6432 [Chthoniobacter sp.]|jgi:FkbM family methyltransferase|nr:hypothetical protein [Chthoniobacter sp.]
MKGIVQTLLRKWGYKISRVESPRIPAGSQERPIGLMESFLEDVAARGLNPKHILDLGANCAEWSQTARRIWPAATFTLVEPQVEMKPHLDAFCAAAPGSRWLRAAAGRAADVMKLTVWPDRKGSSLALTEEELSTSDWERRSVDVVTVDSLFADLAVPKPALAKLDVQGFEVEALMGATQVLETLEVAILEVFLFHVHARTPSFVAVCDFMSGVGFEPYDICGFSRRPYDGALGHTDIAFARRDGFLRGHHQW